MKWIIVFFEFIFLRFTTTPCGKFFFRFLEFIETLVLKLISMSLSDSHSLGKIFFLQMNNKLSLIKHWKNLFWVIILIRIILKHSKPWWRRCIFKNISKPEHGEKFAGLGELLKVVSKYFFFSSQICHLKTHVETVSLVYN